jgi:hypothetical protein
LIGRLDHEYKEEDTVEWKVPVNLLEEKNMRLWFVDFIVFPS